MELLVRLKHERTGRLSFANDDSIIDRRNEISVDEESSGGEWILSSR